jgi:hypothetical protein
VDRDRSGHKVHLIGTGNDAPIRPTPPVRPGSALPGHVQGDDRSGTPKDRLVPELAGRVTLPPRHNTREVGEPAPSSVLAKEPTAGCGWSRWEELAKSARA